MSSKNSKKHRAQKNRATLLCKQGRNEEALTVLAPLKRACPRDAELRHIEGMIHSVSDRYADAVRCFEAALELDPNYVESAFELGIVHMRLCRFNRARPCLRRAKQRNYRSAEAANYLRQIDKVARPEDVTLSACLIVKNEEEHLETCLRSLEAVSDEIVIVDTGSEDQTLAIAERFNARIFHFKWRNDFAAARNFANSQATGDWIFQLDADEELFAEDQHKVRELIHQDECNGAYVALHNRVSNAFGENRPSIHYLARLFKNRPDFRYENAIHETLRISGEVTAVDINILHHGYNLDPDLMKVKRKRNAEILYERLAKKPDDPMTLFYLSMMHLGNREYDEAESFALKALPLFDESDARKQHVHLMLLNNLGMIYKEKEAYDKVEQYCTRAICINENYLDPYFFLGMACFLQNRLDEARSVFAEYLRRRDAQAERPIFNLFGSSADTYLYQVYHFMGKIARRQGDDDSAANWISKALELHPTFWVGWIDLAYIAIDVADWMRAADCFDRGIKHARNNPEVNEENEALWFDFTHAVKSYMLVLQKIREMTREAACDAVE